MSTPHWIFTSRRLWGLCCGLILAVTQFFTLAGVGTAHAATTTCTPAGAMTQCTVIFTYTGAPESWTAPAGVTQATFDLSGARGGIGSLSGEGGRMVATVAVTPGATYQIRVGGEGAVGGYNGGGKGGVPFGNNGGGASDVRRSPFELADRLLVAGGGGGGGYKIAIPGQESNFKGGNGGRRAEKGTPRDIGGSPGGNATDCNDSAGGPGATAGSLGQGGNGATGDNYAGQPTGGGGGGGGYCGGGGGGAIAGGGGGSNYGPKDAKFLDEPRITAEVIITYAFQTPRPSGGVAGWGSNTAGESSAPAGLQAVAVAGGRWHSLALQGDGTVAAWGCANGYNYGQCTPPAELNNVKAIAAAPYHSLAVKGDGTVVAWGCGTGNYGQCTVPAGLSDVKAVAAGLAHSLALKNDGTVVAWGCGAPLNQGQCTIPAGLSGVKALAAGVYHTLALKNNGTVVAWGGGNYTGERTVPAGLTNVIAVAAAGSHSLALKNDGTVVAWGENNAGQNNIPAGLTGVVAIAAGAYHSLALKNDGTVVAWGCGAYNNGQCVVPTGLSGVGTLGAGHLHSLALAATVPAGGVAASAAVSPDAVAQSNAAPTLEGFSLITASVSVDVPAATSPLDTDQALTTTEDAAAPVMVAPAAQSQQIFLPLISNNVAAVTSEAVGAPTSDAGTQNVAVDATVAVTTTLPAAELGVVAPTQPLSTTDAAAAPVPATAPVSVPVAAPVVEATPVISEAPAVTTTEPLTPGVVELAPANPLAGTAVGSPSGLALLALAVVVVVAITWQRRRAKR